MGFLVKYNPAPLPGAKKMSSLLVWQPVFFFLCFFFICRFSIYVHSVILLTHLIALVHHRKSLIFPPPHLYICSPDVLNEVLSICLPVQVVLIVHFRGKLMFRLVLISPLRFVLGITAWMCQKSSEECGSLLWRVI